MKNMKLINAILFTAAAGLIFIQGCKSTITEFPDSNTNVYSVSFESPQDTSHWKGNGQFYIYPEGSPNGGSKSLFVSGGCVVPHAYTELPAPSKNCTVILKCWGRILSGSGSVSLKETASGITLKQNAKAVTGYDWKQYADTLNVAAGNKPVIELISGGIVPANMLIDQIQVYEQNR